MATGNRPAPHSPRRPAPRHFFPARNRVMNSTYSALAITDRVACRPAEPVAAAIARTVRCRRPRHCYRRLVDTLARRRRQVRVAGGGALAAAADARRILRRRARARGRRVAGPRRRLPRRPPPGPPGRLPVRFCPPLSVLASQQCKETKTEWARTRSENRQGDAARTGKFSLRLWMETQ